MLNEFSVKLLKFDQIFMCLNNSHDLLVVNPKPFKGIDNEVINKIRELISASSLAVHLMAWRYSEIDFVPCWERITCSSNAWFVIWRLYNLVSFCDASYDAQVDATNDITAIQREREREVKIAWRNNWSLANPRGIGKVWHYLAIPVKGWRRAHGGSVNEPHQIIT